MTRWLRLRWHRMFPGALIAQEFENDYRHEVGQ